MLGSSFPLQLLPQDLVFSCLPGLSYLAGIDNSCDIHCFCPPTVLPFIMLLPCFANFLQAFSMHAAPHNTCLDLRSPCLSGLTTHVICSWVCFILLFLCFVPSCRHRIERSILIELLFVKDTELLKFRRSEWPLLFDIVQNFGVRSPSPLCSICTCCTCICSECHNWSKATAYFYAHGFPQLRSLYCPRLSDITNA